MLREGEYKDFKSVMETEATVAFNKLVLSALFISAKLIKN